MPAFQPGNLFVCTAPSMKNCSSYTRENKVVKKLVKEKLLVCTGLKNCSTQKVKIDGDYFTSQ